MRTRRERGPGNVAAIRSPKSVAEAISSATNAIAPTLTRKRRRSLVNAAQIGTADRSMPESRKPDDGAGARQARNPAAPSSPSISDAYTIILGSPVAPTNS